MSRMLFALFALILINTGEHRAAVAATLNGSASAVVVAAYDGSTGPVTSYIRLFNGGSAASTFSVTVVGSQSGLAYGQAASIQIPANASIQYSLSQLLALAGSTPGAGVANGDASFALYIQNANAAAGYQHVTFNSANQFFEDASTCPNGLLTAATLANNNTVVVLNAHTSLLAASFPSTIVMQNDASGSSTYTLSIVDAASGTVEGQTTLGIQANATVSEPFTTLQSSVKWQPTAGQDYANVIISSQASGTLPIVVEHTVRTVALGGDINMTTACAVNNPASATLYEGTVAGTSQQSGTMMVSVSAPSAATVQSAAARDNGSVEHIQSLERTAVTTATTTATLLLGGNTLTLSGTFNSSTDAINLSGSGYSFTGTAANGVYSGSYTGPNGIAGSFSSLNANQGAVTAYCGTYTSTRQPLGQAQTTGSGVFNVQIAADGTASGDTTPVSGDTDPGTFTGQANGSTINIVHHSADGDPVNDTDVTATIQNGTVSGTFTTNGGTGSFSGGVCSLPSA